MKLILKFTLDFFASLLFANRKSVGWGIIVRTLSDGEKIIHPAIRIEDKMTFDIQEVQFINNKAFYGEKMQIYPASVSRKKKFYLFKYVNNALDIRCTYARQDFIGAYCNRVLCN